MRPPTLYDHRYRLGSMYDGWGCRDCGDRGDAHPTSWSLFWRWLRRDSGGSD